MDQCQAAVCALRQTGQALMQRLESVNWTVHRKNNDYQNLVTDCDLWVQDQLMEALSKIEPSAALFAEEKENDRIQGLTWIIDPIDGTTNFVAAQKDFALCAALYDGPRPVFGVVFDPAGGNMYRAAAGGTAYLNDRPLEARSPVPLNRSLFDVSLASLNNLSRRAGKPLFEVSRALRGHRALGSASLAMCRIAEGRMEGYLSSKLYPWDYAASGIILQAAGAVYAPLFEEDRLFEARPTPVLCTTDNAMWYLLAEYFRGNTGIESLLSDA
jgi:myo-inositol-1(or 4)-monophosphatase